jgi:hypothetical protein
MADHPSSKELVAKAIERLSRGYFAACVRDREKCGYVMGNVSVADLVDVFEFAVAAIKSEPIAAKQAYVLANFVFETQAWKAARYPSEGDALKSACVVLRAMERAAHEPPAGSGKIVTSAWHCEQCQAINEFKGRSAFTVHGYRCWSCGHDNYIVKPAQPPGVGMHPNCTDPCPICDHEDAAVRHDPTKSAGAS